MPRRQSSAPSPEPSGNSPPRRAPRPKVEPTVLPPEPLIFDDSGRDRRGGYADSWSKPERSILQRSRTEDILRTVVLPIALVASSTIITWYLAGAQLPVAPPPVAAEPK